MAELTASINTACSTEIIDCAIESVVARKVSIGNGSPETGELYGIMAQQIGTVGSRLRESSIDVSWSGLALISYRLKVNILVHACGGLEITYDEAQASLDAQAAAVVTAHERLYAIFDWLCEKREIAQELNSSGFVAASTVFQNRVAAESEWDSNCVMADLQLVANRNTKIMKLLSCRIMDLHACVMNNSVPEGLREADAVLLQVDPSLLRIVSQRLTERSKEVAQLRSAAQSETISEQVNRSHGWRFEKSFNSALAIFDADQLRLLLYIGAQLAQLAVSLNSAVNLLVQNDLAAADLFR